MKANANYILAPLISIILLSCTDKSSESTAPQFTAQGYSIENVQEGKLGQFGSMKLRIESIGHIKKLHIQERSYEIDLATTPERDHFSLFGIEKRASLRTDVTLDFKNYINQKLLNPGKYTFNLKAIDKNGKSSEATLNIRVVDPVGASGPIESGQFQLQRSGKSIVSGDSTFGFTWKTINSSKITIRITKAKDGASKLARFENNDYHRLSTKGELNESINAALARDHIELDARDNAAKDQVFGIKNNANYYLLRVKKSSTSLSRIGTTVTLSGEYKY